MNENEIPPYQERSGRVIYALVQAGEYPCQKRQRYAFNLYPMIVIQVL
jgi:hypothetical protein